MGKNTRSADIKGERKKLTIISADEHALLVGEVETKLKELHQAGAQLNPEALSAFKMEGVFHALVELAQLAAGVSEESALRWADSFYLRSMVRFVDDNLEVVKQEAVRQKLTAGGIVIPGGVSG